MKTLKLIILTTILASVLTLQAQEIDGQLTVNNESEFYLKIGDIDGESQIVNLFKAFKEKEYSIQFNFEGQYPPQQGKTEFTFFKFRTTVKHNGKTIKSLSREPMPYIPGGMFLAPETFDFIPILSMYQQEGMAYEENSGTLPSGKYEVILEAIPEGAGGRVTKGLIMFNVK